MQKILIVDDNEIFVNTLCKELESNINFNTSFIIDKAFYDSTKALEYMHKNLSSIDILLLDLQMPTITGIDILQYIKSTIYRPKIILMTGAFYMLNGLMPKELNVAGILVKPFNTLTLTKLIIDISNELESKCIYSKINTLLSKFEFNKSSLGYKYIVDCIYFCLENNKLITPIEEKLYPKVADKYNVSSSQNIKWAINKAINSMNNYTSYDVIKTFFNNTKPTAKLFISEMFNIIQKDLKDN